MACNYDYTNLQVINICPTKSSFIDTTNAIMLQISVGQMWQYSIRIKQLPYVATY